MPIWDWLFGEKKIETFFRDVCPACLRQGLEGQAQRCVLEGMAKGLRVNPTWAWFQCVYCGARYKRANAPQGELISVTQAEWDESVVPASSAPPRP